RGAGSAWPVTLDPAVDRAAARPARTRSVLTRTVTVVVRINKRVHAVQPAKASGQLPDLGSIYWQRMNAPVHPPKPRVDDAAVQACLRRLGAAATAPWLHLEVARRMAERLALVRLQ